MLLVFAMGLFALGVIGAILLYVLAIFWNGSTGIFTADTWAANFSIKIQEAVFNIAEQLPNAGKLAGVGILIGIVGLMGIGGYAGFRYAQNRGYI